MNQNQKQQNNFSMDQVGELNEKEIELILILRNEFRFGKIEIFMRDGIPQYLEKTIKRKNLGKL